MTGKKKSEKLALNFNKISSFAMKGTGVLIIPVIIQDIETNLVLAQVYTNPSSFEETRKTGKLILWSTSRDERWEKGATSGNKFEVVDILVNCDESALLYMVKATDGASMCHTSHQSCFYRKLNLKTGRVSEI